MLIKNNSGFLRGIRPNSPSLLSSVTVVAGSTSRVVSPKAIMLSRLPTGSRSMKRKRARFTVDQRSWRPMPAVWSSRTWYLVVEDRVYTNSGLLRPPPPVSNTSAAASSSPFSLLFLLRRFPGGSGGPSETGAMVAGWRGAAAAGTADRPTTWLPALPVAGKEGTAPGAVAAPVTGGGGDSV